MNPPSPRLVSAAKEYAKQRVHQEASKEVRMFVREDWLAGARAGIEMVAKLFEIPPGEENNLTTDADAQWKIRALLETK